MFKKVILLTSLLVVGPTFASGTTKLVDYLINSNGIAELVTKTQLTGADAKAVESYINSSLASLLQNKKLSQSELTAFLNKLPAAGEDEKIRKDLLRLLNARVDDLKKDDIVKSINHLVYMANRHGHSLIITCAECKNEAIAKSGFKFTVETIKNSSTKSILENIIPNNPSELHHFIESKMKRLGLGDYSKVSPSMILPEEEKTLALFLALAENGSVEFKKLFNSIKNLSSKNAQTNLFNSSDPHKFWKLASSDLSNAELEKWSEAIDEMVIIVNKEKVSSEEAFYKVLSKRVDEDKVFAKKLKNIKEKHCFFK